jgi:protein phosphatase PTC2/3
LSSQQVVDFIRLKVSEGKELPEIGGMLCDYCLAPDTEPPEHCCEHQDGCRHLSNGCDNMTVLIIAILNGRSIDGWRACVTDRVKKKYGYEMPGSVPQLYDWYRLKNFNARRARQEGKDPGAAKLSDKEGSETSDSESSAGF